MMPPVRSFDGVDGRERGQKKADALRAMTTLGPRTLLRYSENQYREITTANWGLATTNQPRKSRENPLTCDLESRKLGHVLSSGTFM